jgi:hypothetical protein
VDDTPRMSVQAPTPPKWTKSTAHFANCFVQLKLKLTVKTERKKKP